MYAIAIEQIIIIGSGANKTFLQEQEQDQDQISPQDQDQGFSEWLSNLTFEK